MAIFADEYFWEFAYLNVLLERLGLTRVTTLPDRILAIVRDSAAFKEWREGTR